ncbi:MAG: carboxypeptidase-like regulatory domain-containing protein, partial [Bryobacteraceae bacterium]
MRKSRATETMLVCVMAMLIASPATAQVLYGSIVGTILDPSGSVVPGATVSITDKQTGLTRETTADAQGRYLIQNLVPGRYDIKVAASGFRQSARTS